MLDNIIDIIYYAVRKARATPTCGTGRSVWA